MSTETPFEVYEGSKKESRSEQIPFVSLFHRIPKQITDTIQTLGVQEKLIRNSQATGIINPSQIAHDRMLAIIDGIRTPTLLLLFCYLLTYFSDTIFFYFGVFVMMLHGLFHIKWWEMSRTWKLKGTAVKYFYQTHSFFWYTFTITSILILTISLFFVFSDIAANMFQPIIDVVEKVLYYLDLFLTKALNALHKYFELPVGLNEIDSATEIQNVESRISLRATIMYISFMLYTVSIKFFMKKRYELQRHKNIKSSDEALQYRSQIALERLEELAKEQK